MGIRWRLAIWNTLTLALLLVGFAVLVYALLSRALHQRLDKTLLTGFEELERDPRLGSDVRGRLRHWIYEFKEHENLFAVVYAPDGTVFERTAELAVDSVPQAPAEGGPPSFDDKSFPLIGRQRI